MATVGTGARNRHGEPSASRSTPPSTPATATSTPPRGAGTRPRSGTRLPTATARRFFTSRVLPRTSNRNYDAVVEASTASLERPGTDYLDRYPSHRANPAISPHETLQALAHSTTRG